MNNFKNKKSVRVEEDNGWVNEYDQHDRNTFHQMPSGYWCLYFYDEPKEGEKPKLSPYMVVHKYWDYYNKLK